MHPHVDLRYAHELGAGEGYASLRFRIPAEVNQQYLFALEAYASEYLGAPGARAVVHPVLLLHMSARTRSPSFRLAPDTGSVFAQDSVTFRRPAFVDEWLDVHWRIRDVYERKGRLYQALDTQVTTADGAAVLSRDAHSVFFTRSGEPLSVPPALHP
jgi:acyl dehydratase